MPADRTPPTRPDQLAAALRAGETIDYRSGTTAAPAAAPNRPNIVLYPAVLAIVLGTAGALCCGVGVGGQGLVVIGNPQTTLPDGNTFVQDLSVARYTAAMGIVDFLLSAALLAAGIGALKFRPWARRLAVAVAPFLILVAGVRGLAFAGWVGPYEIDVWERVAKATPSTQPATDPPGSTQPAAATQPVTTQPAATGPAATRPAATQSAATTQPGTEAGPTLGARPRTMADEPETAQRLATMRRATPVVATIMFVVQALVPAVILAAWTRPTVRALFGPRK